MNIESRPESMLRIASFILAAAAMAFAAFGYWGIFTQAGQRNFDEMDGMIPFAFAVLGGVLAIGAAVTWYISRRIRRSP